MARKQLKVSRRMVFTWFMLAGLIFLLAPQNWTNKFQFAFARLFRFPLGVSRSVSLFVRARQLNMDVVSRTEYNQLLNHLANLKEELRQEHQKVAKLSQLRSRASLEGVKFVLADVIKESIDSSQNELIINRGRDDGLAVGQFVLGDNSIIGTISDVSSRTAQVGLITDTGSKIPVTIEGLEVNRIMQGQSGNLAKIQMLSTKHKVANGAAVYACKKPGFLPTPMIVGRVYSCKRDDESPSLWDVTVRPACNIENLNDVAVLIMNPQM